MRSLRLCFKDLCSRNLHWCLYSKLFLAQGSLWVGQQLIFLLFLYWGKEWDCSVFVKYSSPGVLDRILWAVLLILVKEICFVLCLDWRFEKGYGDCYAFVRFGAWTIVVSTCFGLMNVIILTRVAGEVWPSSRLDGWGLIGQNGYSCRGVDGVGNVLTYTGRESIKSICNFGGISSELIITKHRLYFVLVFWVVGLHYFLWDVPGSYEIFHVCVEAGWKCYFFAVYRIINVSRLYLFMFASVGLFTAILCSLSLFVRELRRVFVMQLFIGWNAEVFPFMF